MVLPTSRNKGRPFTVRSRPPRRDQLTVSRSDAFRMHSAPSVTDCGAAAAAVRRGNSSTPAGAVLTSQPTTLSLHHLTPVKRSDYLIYLFVIFNPHCDRRGLIFASVRGGWLGDWYVREFSVSACRVSFVYLRSGINKQRGMKS